MHRLHLVALLLCVRSLVAAETVPPLFIEGYAGKVSYAPGEELTLHVSTSAPVFLAKIERLGAEAGGRLDQRIDSRLRILHPGRCLVAQAALGRPRPR